MCSHVTVCICLTVTFYVPCDTPSLPNPFFSTSREAGTENWGTEGCQTLASTTVHTKCLCSRISTYAVLAQQAKDPVSHQSIARCTLWNLRANKPITTWHQVSEMMS